MNVEFLEHVLDGRLDRLGHETLALLSFVKRVTEVAGLERAADDFGKVDGNRVIPGKIADGDKAVLILA